MKITKTQNFILFTLGKWYEEANKKIKGKPLLVCISKKIFIDLVKNSKITKKQDRALYKNLETLEKSKLITYKNRSLRLTQKGNKIFQKIHRDVKDYILINTAINPKTVTKAKKIQTVFKQNSNLDFRGYKCIKIT